MKLSKVQLEVLKLMANGWSLCISTNIWGTSRLQKGGCGRGGETKTVSAATIHALSKKGFIEGEWKPLRYELFLTYKGREIVGKVNS